jgi:hypothetical protein
MGQTGFVPNARNCRIMPFYDWKNADTGKRRVLVPNVLPIVIRVRCGKKLRR